MSSFSQFPAPSARYTVASSFSLPNYPAEGMLVWLEDTQQLVVYTDGKWQDASHRTDVTLYSNYPPACWSTSGTQYDAIAVPSEIHKIEVLNTDPYDMALHASTCTTGVSDRVSLFAGATVPAGGILTLEVFLPVPNLQIGYVWEWDPLWGPLPSGGPLTIAIFGRPM